MKTLLMLTACALIASWSTTALAEDNGSTVPAPAPMPQQDSTTTAPNESADSKTAGSSNCYSARGCSGKVLNHKDRHNCKNSRGKSWRDGRTGTCYSPV